MFRNVWHLLEVMSKKQIKHNHVNKKAHAAKIKRICYRESKESKIYIKYRHDALGKLRTASEEFQEWPSLLIERH